MDLANLVLDHALCVGIKKVDLMLVDALCHATAAAEIRAIRVIIFCSSK